eukprot:GHVL01009877.1.p1 GENE.GHVL01009877.1~~GHVL01009877.1.p1  ORF type:complete len:436 (+),score=52.55 GHVL01009877.1:168-1475(+)
MPNDMKAFMFGLRGCSEKDVVILDPDCEGCFKVNAAVLVKSATGAKIGRKDARIAARLKILPFVDLRKIWLHGGSPLRMDNLLEAGIASAGAAVVLPQAFDSRANPMGPKQRFRYLQAMDTATILKAHQVSRQANEQTNLRVGSLVDNQLETTGGASPDIWIIAQLLQGQNVKYFSGPIEDLSECQHDSKKRWQDNNPMNLSQMFAAGKVISSTILDRVLAETFFNPKAIDIIQLLLFGDTVTGGHLFQLPVIPSNLIGFKYGDIGQRLLRQRALLIGLYRSPVGTPAAIIGHLEKHLAERFQDTPHHRMTNKDFLTARRSLERLPFVFTNPPHDAVLKQHDRLFLLARGTPNMTALYDTPVYDTPRPCTSTHLNSLRNIKYNRARREEQRTSLLFPPRLYTEPSNIRRWMVNHTGSRSPPGAYNEMETYHHTLF